MAEVAKCPRVCDMALKGLNPGNWKGAAALQVTFNSITVISYSTGGAIRHSPVIFRGIAFLQLP
jgi:hypothetical protein